MRNGTRKDPNLLWVGMKYLQVKPACRILKWPLTYFFPPPQHSTFCCQTLIQRLVTSNPSPAYIQRVVEVWRNDGNHVEGNLAAVVKAILLDPEARECDGLTEANFGKMTEPVLRLTHLYRAIGVDAPSGYFFNHGSDLENYLLQHPFLHHRFSTFICPIINLRDPTRSQFKCS